MWVFGYAWKINFLENIFSWPCVLMALTRKLVSVKIFTSNHFRTHAQRERERERKKRDPRSYLWLRRRTQSLDYAFDFADLRTHEPIFDPWAFDFASNPKPSRHEPTNNLSLCDFDFLCDFDRPMNRSKFLCDFDFLLSLFDLWFLLLLLWWCGWWWKIAFSKCYQTHENIF